MSMLNCKICGCRCDPSDTVNGVCDDCRAEKQKIEEKHEKLSRMMKSDSRQMRLEEFLV